MNGALDAFKFGAAFNTVVVLAAGGPP